MKKLYRKIFPNYISMLKREIQNLKPDCILDLGCGDNSPIQYIDLDNISKIGVDVFQPSLDRSKKKRIHDRYILKDLQEYLDNAEEEFDIILLNDVVEHFDRDSAEKLIKSAEKRSAKGIIILTPNGFIRQGDVNRNPWQIHKSGFCYWDFEKRGYKTKPIGGLKLLRGEEFKPKYFGEKYGEVLCDISRIITFVFPRLSYSVMAVKNNEDFNIK